MGTSHRLVRRAECVIAGDLAHLRLLTARNARSFFAIKLPRLLTGSEERPSLFLLALCAIASFVMVGYRFAVWDQLLYLGFVDRYFQPIVDHPGDLYLQHFLWRSYTTFWMAIYPLKQLFGWEWPLFVIHLVVKFFIYWGIWSLTYTFTKNRATAWFTVLLMLMNQALVNGNINFYMADTITRYVAVPFLLFGASRWWRGKHLSAALLFGLAFQIHLLSTVYWMLALGIAWCITREKLDYRGLAIFGALAAPILVWYAIAEWGGVNPAPDTTYREFVQIYHPYAFLTPHGADAWKTLLFCALLILAGWTDRRYRAFALAIVAVAGIQYVAADVFFWQPILRFQLSRMLDIFGLLGMIGAAQILATHPRRWLAGLVGGVLLVGVVVPGANATGFVAGAFLVLLLALEARAVIPALALLAVIVMGQVFDPTHIFKRPVWGGFLATVLAVAAALSAGWFRFRHAGFWIGLVLLVVVERLGVTATTPRQWWQAASAKIDWPGQGMQSDWIQLQLWVRDHTPPGTMFFVPPGFNGFRVFSQRSAFFESYDREPAIFHTGYAAALLERMKLLGYWPLSDRWADKSEQVYYRLSASEWQSLARQYDVPYLITARPVNLPFQQLHVRGNLTLWKIGP